MTASSSSASGLGRLAAGGIVTAVLGASAIIGHRNAPSSDNPGIDRWYHRLSKPGYTPPDSAFGLVWPLLESGMAVGGYRLLRQPPSRPRNLALTLWLGTSAMIGGWTSLFFRQRDLTAGTVAAAAMTVASAAYVASAARVDRAAAAAGVPLTAWLGFATLLADGVRRRNPA